MQKEIKLKRKDVSTTMSQTGKKTAELFACFLLIVYFSSLPVTFCSLLLTFSSFLRYESIT